MTKKIFFIIICLLFINYQAQAGFFKKNEQKNQNVQNVQNADIGNNSYYNSDFEISADSQTEVEKATFRDKLINSSHFSSTTATRTYIPINKIED